MVLQIFKIGLSILAAVFSICLVIFSPGTLSETEITVAGLTLVVITLWVTRIIAEHQTAILFFMLSMILSVAPAPVVFSGFSSSAFWLVFGGFILGTGINETGLGERIAEKIAIRLNGSYARLISGLVLIGLFFSFIMPSAMGRVVLLVPIALKISKTFGFKKGSNGLNGVVLATILGSVFPAFAILPANVSNMILSGLSESLYGYSPLYGEYLLLHFPVLGLLKAGFIIILILWLYPANPCFNSSHSDKNRQGMDSKELLLACVLSILMILWFLDFKHHISPAWIALGGALFIMLPKIDIVSTHQFNRHTNIGSLIYIAGVLGLGSVINDSGLGKTMADQIIPHLPFNEATQFINYVSLSVTALFTGVIATMPGIPAILTPLSHELSISSGFPLKSVLMTQVFGFATAVFPYQLPPLIIGLHLGRINFSEALKVCMVLTIISVFILLPLSYYWWKLVGWM